MVCTDSQSVLTFLEELSGFLSQASDQLLKKYSPGNIKSLKKRPCIRLKISSKYPIEGSDAYACLIEKLNLMLLEVNLDDVDQISSCNKENDENQSKCVANIECGVEEITILNPTWVFDSISDYSIMSTA